MPELAEKTANNALLKLLSRLFCVVGIPVVGFFAVALLDNIRNQSFMIQGLQQNVALLTQRMEQRELAYVDLAAKVRAIELTQYTVSNADRDIEPIEKRLENIEDQVERLLSR